MKKLFTLALLLSLTTMFVNAQDKTTVTANSSEISDNLDLRAIATIFGESSDLEDFEKRINDPKAQISNLDLNGDNYVDYLRVIESIEGNDHIIIVQSVIDKDLYQDVATIEVQRDKNNKVQVQVVGDVYMYGENYIYEPVYVHTPVIYTTFWVTNYRPYYSSWYWGYYPSYYSYWRPFPVFRYRNHINVYIGGYGHVYNYVNYRNCRVSYNAYYGRRANAYEVRYPNRSFSHRNASVTNRYELDRTRSTRTVNARERGNTQPRIASSNRSDNSTRNNNSTRSEVSTREGNTRATTSTKSTTSTRSESPRATTSTRDNSASVETPRSTTATRNESTRANSSTRNTTSTRAERSNTSSSPRVSTSTRSSSPKAISSNRGSSSTRTSAPSRSSSPSRASAPSRSSSPSMGSSRGSSSNGGSSTGSSSRGGSSRGGRG